MSSKRWFSRMGRRGGRQKEPETLSAAVQNVRDARRGQNRSASGSSDESSGLPLQRPVPSEPSPLPPPEGGDHNAVVVEQEEEEEEVAAVIGEQPRNTRPAPSSLFGSQQLGSTPPQNRFARDALAGGGERNEFDRYGPPMESNNINRRPYMEPPPHHGPGPSFHDDHYDPPMESNHRQYMGLPPSYDEDHGPSRRGPLMGRPPSFEDDYGPPPGRGPLMGSPSYNDDYAPSGRGPLMGPSSYSSSGYSIPPPPREVSSLHDLASAKMAAYQSSGRGGGGGGNSEDVMIPIAPGVSAKLRGANETFECIERDFYVPVTCFACSLEMCCIQDADYVICPVCRVVSPLDTGSSASPHLSTDFRGQREPTVGLGFTFEDLCKWQAEILARRTGPTV